MTWEALADWLLLGSAVLGIVYVTWDEMRARWSANARSAARRSG